MQNGQGIIPPRRPPPPALAGEWTSRLR